MDNRFVNIGNVVHDLSQFLVYYIMIMIMIISNEWSLVVDQLSICKMLNTLNINRKMTKHIF
jgi:hypothetical protein